MNTTTESTRLYANVHIGNPDHIRVTGAVPEMPAISIDGTVLVFLTSIPAARALAEAAQAVLDELEGAELARDAEWREEGAQRLHDAIIARDEPEASFHTHPTATCAQCQRDRVAGTTTIHCWTPKPNGDPYEGTEVQQIAHDAGIEL